MEKLHRMNFKIFFFFLKKFEKDEKTGIICSKVSLWCTPSVILGSSLWKEAKQSHSKIQDFLEESEFKVYFEVIHSLAKT